MLGGESTGVVDIIRHLSGHLKNRLFIAKTTLAVASISGLVFSAAPFAELPAAASDSNAQARLKPEKRRTVSPRLPIRFEINKGQTSSRVRFIGRAPGHTFFLTEREAVFKVGGGQTAYGYDAAPDPIRMRLTDANRHPRIHGLGRLDGVTNYLRGADPAGWVTGVPGYEKVALRQVYPGIDLIYHSSKGPLEYDFVLAPGADPRKIKIEVEGAAVSLNGKGDLVIAGRGGGLRQPRPAIYQNIGGKRRVIKGEYVLHGKHHAGFRVAPYDKSRPLIIDPVVIAYSTYQGGERSDIGEDIARDAEGKIYVTGTTASLNFPFEDREPEDGHGNHRGSTDAFVTKIDPSARGRSSLVFSTYLGGAAEEDGLSVAVDGSQSVYVAGRTTSGDFPVTANVIMQSAPPGPSTLGFVSKLAPNGSTPVYSTYFPGFVKGIGVDRAGRAYITGQTRSTVLPVTGNAFQRTLADPQGDAFVSRLNPNGAGADYSTYLGGGIMGAVGDGDTGNDIAVDSSGRAHVVGTTWTPDFPTRAPFQPARSGDEDVFVAKINPDAAAGPLSLMYSTYLGGGNLSGCPPVSNNTAGTLVQCEGGTAIALDYRDKVYITGFTASSRFPVTPNAYRTAISRASPYYWDAFVAHFDPDLGGPASLVYSTYFGGARDEEGRGIAVHPGSGDVYVTGVTLSRREDNFPLEEELQEDLKGSSDAFLARLDIGDSVAEASSLVFASYLGGSNGQTEAAWKKKEFYGTRPCCSPGPNGAVGVDVANSVAVDETGSAYLAGTTSSNNFPTVNGHQTSKPDAAPSLYPPPADPDSGDVFVAVIGPPPPRPPQITGLSTQSGSACGGDRIKIVGANLAEPPMTVEFESATLDRAAQVVDVKPDGTELTVVTPAFDPGPATVRVQTGEGSAGAPLPFVFLPAICRALDFEVPFGEGAPESGSHPDPETGQPGRGQGLDPKSGVAAGPPQPPALPAGAPAPAPGPSGELGAIPGALGQAPVPGTAAVGSPGLAPSTSSPPVLVTGPASLAESEAASAAAPGAALSPADAEKEAAEPAPRFSMVSRRASGLDFSFAAAWVFSLIFCGVKTRKELRRSWASEGVRPAVRPAV